MCADMYRPQRRCSGCDSCCQENLWGEPERIYYIINPLWENEDDAVVLIDASNAFNSLTGRQRFTTFSSNLYQPSARLFVQGGAEISSTEVTTQSGPESMATHAIATVSLLNKRSWNQPNNLIIQRETHVAYADDAVGAGKMSHALANLVGCNLWIWSTLWIFHQCKKVVDHNQTSHESRGRTGLLRRRDQHHDWLLTTPGSLTGLQKL